MGCYVNRQILHMSRNRSLMSEKIFDFSFSAHKKINLLLISIIKIRAQQRQPPVRKSKIKSVIRKISRKSKPDPNMAIP